MTMAHILPIVTALPFIMRLSIIDVRPHRLPNTLVATLTAVVVSSEFLAGAISKDSPTVAGVLKSAICLLGTFVALQFLSRGALGMGDIKFSFPIGLLVGWYAPNSWLIFIWLSFAGAALWCLTSMKFLHREWRSQIALGPFMSLALIITCGVPLLSL